MPMNTADLVQTPQFVGRETDPENRSNLAKSPSECKQRQPTAHASRWTANSVSPPHHKAPWMDAPGPLSSDQISQRSKALEASGVLGNSTHYLLACEGKLPSVPVAAGPFCSAKTLATVCAASLASPVTQCGAGTSPAGQ